MHPSVFAETTPDKPAYVMAATGPRLSGSRWGQVE